MKHVCGLQGFNPMLGDICERCRVDYQKRIGYDLQNQTGETRSNEMSERDVDVRVELPDLDPDGELNKMDDYYRELHGEGTDEESVLSTGEMEGIFEDSTQTVKQFLNKLSRRDSKTRVTILIDYPLR